jgi:UDP-N-acetyl-D-mannosaminuronic acid transferase (WecB/TagA/CpsF family)
MQAATLSVREEIPAVSLFGVRVHAVSMDEAIRHILCFVQERIPRQVVTADSSMVVMAQQDAHLSDIINRADLSHPGQHRYPVGVSKAGHHPARARQWGGYCGQTG